VVRKKKMVGLHAHGCVVCHGRYEDACTDLVNARCYGCRTGRPGWTELVDARLPKDCCRYFSRLTSKDERTTYKLMGAAPWFICSECKRTFPYASPKEN
jgi:hypothetical protein